MMRVFCYIEHMINVPSPSECVSIWRTFHRSEVTSIGSQSSFTRLKRWGESGASARA